MGVRQWLSLEMLVLSRFNGVIGRCLDRDKLTTTLARRCTRRWEVFWLRMVDGVFFGFGILNDFELVEHL